MKAYIIHDRDYVAEYSLIVFAESRGKAISYALGTDEFPYGDYDFTQLSARRAKWADKYYHGSREMDWYNPEERLAMVRDGGYVCDDDSFDPDDCERCSAKDICEKYEDYMDECAEEQDGEM